MPISQDDRAIWGTGFLLSKISLDYDELREALTILGGPIPIPDPLPGPEPIASIDVDLDNDGDADVRVTVDDIPED